MTKEEQTIKDLKAKVEKLTMDKIDLLDQIVRLQAMVAHLAQKLDNDAVLSRGK